MSSIKKLVENTLRTIRKRLRHVSLLHSLWRWVRRPTDAVSEAARVTRLRIPIKDEPAAVLFEDYSGDVFISLTSFPARIGKAWIAIEGLLRQDSQPDGVFLILSEADFPSRHLPRKIREQQRRGLEVYWTRDNIRSYKKLVPLRAAHPAATIVTVDDDFFYEPWMLSRLLLAASQYPDSIVGHRGQEIQFGPCGLMPYRGWPNASLSSHSSRVVLGSGGGVLYPPDSLPLELLCDMSLASDLCPTADDIWYWALARVIETPTVCLGSRWFRAVNRQSPTPALWDVNRDGGNDLQLERVIRHFKISLE